MVVGSLGVQVSGLTRLHGIVAEVLDDTNSHDLMIFVEDLRDLVRQFPAYREFLKEAGSTDRKLSSNQNNAGIEAMQDIAAQPDSIVQQDIKETINELVVLQHEIPSDTIEFAIDQSLGNIWRAIGRWIKDRVENLGKGITKAIDKALLTFVLSGSMIAGAAYLGIMYPAQFSWIAELIKIARSLL